MEKNKKVNVRTTTERRAVDKISLCVVITTVIIIVVVVITGICVRFLLEDAISRIILIALICFLAILGVMSLTFLEIRRRTVAKKNRAVVVRNGDYYNIQPSAPSRDTDTSWQYSNRSTIPA